MTTKKLEVLKAKIERHYDHLIKKYPMTKIVLESIEALLCMDASEDLIRPWYSSILIFMRDIEKEINKIESEQSTIK